MPDRVDGRVLDEELQGLDPAEIDQIADYVFAYADCASGRSSEEPGRFRERLGPEFKQMSRRAHEYLLARLEDIDVIWGLD